MVDGELFLFPLLFRSSVLFLYLSLWVLVVQHETHRKASGVDGMTGVILATSNPDARVLFLFLLNLMQAKRAGACNRQNPLPQVEILALPTKASDVPNKKSHNSWSRWTMSQHRIE